MTETQKYLYADSDRQTERVNWLEWQVFTMALLTLFTTTAFDSYYMRFAVVAPMAVYILYYDSKFMASSAVAIMLTEIATTVQKFFKPDCTVDRIDICTATAIVIFYLIVVCFIERIGKKFRLDMLGSLQDEKDHLCGK